MILKPTPNWDDWDRVRWMMGEGASPKLVIE